MSDSPNNRDQGSGTHLRKPNRRWISGDFDRTKVARGLHRLAPAHAAECLHAVSLEDLWEKGKRLILLDVDNTMVGWHAEEFSDEVTGWLRNAKSMGFGLCILSNTRNNGRLNRISQTLDIPTVRGRFKPSRAMYLLALDKFRVHADAAVMIGDQLFTDVLGANRAGIDAIWVRQLDKHEFGPTRWFSRNLERLVQGTLYRALVLPEDGAVADPAHPLVSELTLFKQLVRFAVVGGSALAIDTVLKYILIRGIHVGGEPLGTVVGRMLMDQYPSLFARDARPENAAAPYLGNVASFLVMFYSYFLNRIWTFEAQGKESQSVQIRRFFTIAIIGALINNALFGVFLKLFQGRFGFAVVLAAAIAAIWNFVGQRIYAFRGGGASSSHHD